MKEEIKKQYSEKISNLNIVEEIFSIDTWDYEGLSFYALLTEERDETDEEFYRRFIKEPDNINYLEQVDIEYDENQINISFLDKKFSFSVEIPDFIERMKWRNKTEAYNFLCSNNKDIIYKN